MTTLAGVLLLFLFIVIELPIALAMMLSGAIGLWMTGGMDALWGSLLTLPLSAVASYEFVMVPMFILMANMILGSGISKELFDIARIWTGRTKAGLAYATVITGAAFGAICGSSAASAATLSSTTIPGMVREGYDKRLAAGVVGISGSLAMLIPPSSAMIIYALLANLNVAHMLIAGVIPGILAALTIALTVRCLIFLNPQHAPQSRSYSIREKIAALRHAWPFFVLFIAVTVTIYTGVATPTEASGIGAFVAFLLACWRRMSWRSFCTAFTATVRASCMIGFIVLGAQFFGQFLTLAQFTPNLFRVIEQTQLSGTWIIFALVLLYLILGCFMELVAMLILTVPIVSPLIVHLGYDPVWFAVITIMLGEIGVLTPPLGINVFIISKYTNISIVDGFRGSIPHVLAHLLLIGLLIVFPSLVMWLPETMR